MSVSDNDGALAGSNKIALSKEFDIAYIYAIEDIGKIEDVNILKQLLLSTISVSSLEEFAQLVNSNLPESD